MTSRSQAVIDQCVHCGRVWPDGALGGGQWLTDAKGNFVFDKDGKYINRLTYPIDDTGRTLMDALKEEVYKYKQLQN